MEKNLNDLKAFQSLATYAYVEPPDTTPLRGQYKKRRGQTNDRKPKNRTNKTAKKSRRTNRRPKK